jgi:hypothetical protein
MKGFPGFYWSNDQKQEGYPKTENEVFFGKRDF